MLDLHVYGAWSGTEIPNFNINCKFYIQHMDKTDETWTCTLNYVAIKAGNQSTSPKVFPKTLPQSADALLIAQRSS